MSEYLPSSLTNPPDEDKQAALVSQINALLTTANEQYNAYALDVGVSVLPISNVLYTAAADGTSADAVGTSGEMTYQVDYDVTYPEGGSSRYTLVVDFATTIEPVLYEGVMDEQAVEAARAALEGKALGYLSYAYDSGESGKVAAAMAACSTALASVPDAAGVVLAVSLAEDTSVPVISMPHSAPVDNCIVTVQIAKGAHFATAAATCSLTEAKDPRIDATLTAIENAVAGITLPQYDTPDMMVYYQYVDDIVQTVVPSGMSAAYNQDSVFSPFSIVLPINGTTENQYGTDGSFVFAYSVSNNDQSYYNSITRTFTLTAPAKPLDVLAYAARLVWNADYPETFEYSDSADFPASIVSTVQGIANTALAPYAEAGLQPAASPIVRQMNYTAPVHGTPSAPDGTQGAMKIALGVQLADTSNTSVQYGFAINPIPYDTRLTNAKSALEAGFGSAVATSEGDVQSAVQASIADRVTDIMTAYKGEHATFGSVTSSISYGAYTAPVDGATGSPQGTSGSQAFTVTLSNALGQTVTTGTITQTIAADDITLSEAQRIASIALLPGSFSINSYTGAAYTTAAAGAEAVAYVGNIVQNALNGSAGLGSVTKSVSAANVQDTGLYYHNAFSATVNVTLSYGGASVSLPSTSMQVSMYPEPTGFLNSYIASYDEEFSNKTISVDAASNTADGCKQQITYAQVSNIYSVHMDIVTDSFVAATETTPGSYAYHVMYTLSPGGFTANSQGYTATVNLVTPE